jgi:hypothetical protein
VVPKPRCGNRATKRPGWAIPRDDRPRPRQPLACSPATQWQVFAQNIPPVCRALRPTHGGVSAVVRWWNCWYAGAKACGVSGVPPACRYGACGDQRGGVGRRVGLAGWWPTRPARRDRGQRRPDARSAIQAPPSTSTATPVKADIGLLISGHSGSQDLVLRWPRTASAIMLRPPSPAHATPASSALGRWTRPSGGTGKRIVGSVGVCGPISLGAGPQACHSRTPGAARTPRTDVTVVAAVATNPR